MEHLDIFKFDSAREYLKQVIQTKRQDGDAYSLRAIARRLNVSPSTLSEYINNKKTVSQGTAIKLSQWLRLQSRERNYLETLFMIEATRSSAELKVLSENLNELRRQARDARVEDIRKFIETVSVSSARVYVRESTFKTRTLLFLKDARTQRPIRSFCEEFFLPVNGQSDKVYFLENDDGTFRAIRSPFHPRIPQDGVLAEKNKSLRVHFDRQGFPTIEKLYLYLASSEAFVIGSIHYSASEMQISGRLWCPQKGYLQEKKSEFYRAI